MHPVEYLADLWLDCRYTGVDVELSLQLSTLLFFCHRPTVAALMVLGTDLAAITALLAGPAVAQVCDWLLLETFITLGRQSSTGCKVSNSL